MFSSSNDIIYTYSALDAVNDGLLAEPYPERFPRLLITRRITQACSEQPGRSFDEALVPLLIDAIVAVKAAIARGGPRPPITLEHTVAGTVNVYPNELGGMTLTTPGEN